MIHQRRKTAFVPNRAYAASGELPTVPITLTAAPWEDAVTVPVLRAQGLPNTGKAQGVVIMGVKFPSLTNAADVLAIDKRTLMEAYRGKRLDGLLATLLKREATGQRPHRTITRLFANRN